MKKFKNVSAKEIISNDQWTIVWVSKKRWNTFILAVDSAYHSDDEVVAFVKISNNYAKKLFKKFNSQESSY